MSEGTQTVEPLIDTQELQEAIMSGGEEAAQAVEETAVDAVVKLQELTGNENI